jgi:hypothetical protein
MYNLYRNQCIIASNPCGWLYQLWIASNFVATATTSTYRIRYRGLYLATPFTSCLQIRTFDKISVLLKQIQQPTNEWKTFHVMQLQSSASGLKSLYISTIELTIGIIFYSVGCSYYQAIAFSDLSDCPRMNQRRVGMRVFSWIMSWNISKSKLWV